VADAGKSRIQKPLREEKKEKEKDQSINQSRGGGRASDDGVPGEGSIDPELGNAIRLLAEVVGSPEDPDFEKADRLAKRWAATDGARAVLDATLDWIAKKSDRSEYRAFSEALFGGYVRQAVKKRLWAGCRRGGYYPTWRCPKTRHALAVPRRSVRKLHDLG
jgi:hypothetical protein